MGMESVRRITIRVPGQLHRALSRVASKSELSLNQLAVEAFEEYLNSQAAQGKFPLAELNRLLAPAARARKLRESDAVRHAKEARRRIWEERYRPAVEQVEKSQSSRRQASSHSTARRARV